jgi:hypothetical protein
MKRAADWSAIDDRLVPLAGRRGEVERLVCALQARQSRLITGPPGMGKTRLLAEAVSQCVTPCLLIRAPRVLHDLLAQLAGMLACGVTGDTSMSLKPAVLDSLKHAPRVVLLEDVTEADPRMYRFLQAIYHSPGNCLIVTARARESLGYLRRLLWDPRRNPLTAAHARPCRCAVRSGRCRIPAGSTGSGRFPASSAAVRAGQPWTDCGDVPAGGAARVSAGAARQVSAVAHGRTASVYRMK